MTSQVKYNTKQTTLLLQILIYLMDTHQITYEEFYELTGDNNYSFSIAMKQINEMINDLSIPATLINSKKDNIEGFNSNIYYYQSLEITPSYDIEGLPEDKLILYSMVIVYLMLKNQQYVSTKVLSKILPRFTGDTMMKMIQLMMEVIPETIEKNALQSYVLINE